MAAGGTVACQGVNAVPDSEGGLHGAARYRSVAVIMMGISLSTLDGTIMHLALPDIARDLHASAADSVWIVNAYQIAILALLLPAASLGGIIGHRRVYLWGVAIMLASAVFCFMAPNLTMLALGRSLQGLGAAGTMAVNASLMRLTYPRSLLGRGMVLNAAIIATSSCAGPSIAALVLSMSSWHWLFAFNIPLCILIIVMGWRVLPYNPPGMRAGHALAARDVVLNILMFGLILLGVRLLAGQTGAASVAVSVTPIALALLAAGLVVGYFYLRRQVRARVPLFPVDLLRLPKFRAAVGNSMAAFIAQTLAFIGLPFLMLEGWHYTHLQAAALLTAWPLAIVLVAPLTVRLIGRTPAGVLGAVGLGMLATGLALLALLPAHPELLDVAWRIGLCGAGFGLFQSPNNHTIVSTPPPERSGAGSGMLGTARLGGQMIGALILSLLFGMVSAHDGPGPVIALALGAVFAGVASVLCIKRQRAERRSAAPAR